MPVAAARAHIHTHTRTGTHTHTGMPPPLLSARACQPQEGKRPREREVERKGNERGQKNERQGFSLLFWRAKAEAGEKEGATKIFGRNAIAAANGGFFRHR